MPKRKLSDDERRRIINETEDYQSTVSTIVAFVGCVTHDGRAASDGRNYGLGRRMSDPAGHDLTPDLVVQKSPSYGVVTEVKRSLPNDQQKWYKPVEQMRKYDADLAGWWTSDESMGTADAVLLLHHSRSRPFRNFLDNAKKDDPTSVGERTSLVEFSRSDESAPYFHFRLEWGAIRDSALSIKLSNGVQVPREKVLLMNPSLAFYDARPPAEHFLAFLWMDYFASRRNDVEFDEQLKAYPIDVNIEEVTNELQVAFGSGTLTRDERSAEFPKKSWVADALDTLVRLKYALHVGDGVTRVLFKDIKEDILEHFGAQLIADEVTVEDETQTNLFEPAGPSN